MDKELTYANGEATVEIPSGNRNEPQTKLRGVQPVRIDWEQGELTGTIRTDVKYDGKGTVYAVETVRHGSRRVDWKMGHIDGTYAEGFDCYYNDELIKKDEFHKNPQERLIAKFKDDVVYDAVKTQHSEEKDDSNQGKNASIWAIERFGTTVIRPERRLHEIYPENDNPNNS